MKILIVSDTHGKLDNLEIALKEVGKIDELIHLGDIEGDEDRICAMAGCPVEMVAGNNDFFSNLDREKMTFLGKKSVLLTHGHLYGVSIDDKYIMAEAAARNFDIVMYGHTHKPVMCSWNGVVALNPGSLSYPRQAGRKPTYMTMELDENGEADYQLHYIE